MRINEDKIKKIVSEQVNNFVSEYKQDEKHGRT